MDTTPDVFVDQDRQMSHAEISHDSMTPIGRMTRGNINDWTRHDVFDVRFVRRLSLQDDPTSVVALRGNAYQRARK